MIRRPPRSTLFPLHDALPISRSGRRGRERVHLSKRELRAERQRNAREEAAYIAKIEDRKSTRLNSSHGYISYAVFCLKKKKKDIVSYHIPFAGRDSLSRLDDL